MRRAWLPSTCCAIAETNPRPFSTPSELNGADLRREPIEVRKATLASILRKIRPGVRLNEHLEHDCGQTVFQHACKMGLEGIVSKRLGSHYRSGRSPDWLKFKNPDAPAVKREAEEDWR
jgi:bifunctional non-homologous end joining protein LigD